MIKLNLAKEFLTMINVICQVFEILIIFFVVGLVAKMFINAEEKTHFSRDNDYRIKLIAISLVGGGTLALVELIALLLVMNAKITSSDRLIILMPLAAAIITVNVMLIMATAPNERDSEKSVNLKDRADTLDLEAELTRRHITEQEQYINQKKAYFEQRIKFHEMRKTVDELLRKRDDR